jgi:phage shock protein E
MCERLLNSAKVTFPALNIPLNELKLKSDLIRKWNKPVITVCRSGNRSGIAKGILKATGIDAYNGGPGPI